MFSLDPFIKATTEYGLAIDSVMVVQNGQEPGLHRFTDNGIHNIYSVSKLYAVTAIGMAMEEGLLSPEDRPVDFFPSLLPEDLDLRWERVHMKHLLTMTSGHGEAFLMPKERRKLRGEQESDLPEEMKAEWLKYSFTRPMMYEPGTKFCYGNLAPYVAGRMLEKAVGMSMLDYLYKKLWEPLGKEKPRWDPDTNGHTFPSSGLYRDITDMIRIGELYLGKGKLKGRRFFPEDWAEQVMAKQVDSEKISRTEAPDELAGYGYYLWKNHGAEGFRAFGREGQFVIILPEHEAVIATQAADYNTQQILDLIWEHILPQLS